MKITTKTRQLRYSNINMANDDYIKKIFFFLACFIFSVNCKAATYSETTEPFGLQQLKYFNKSYLQSLDNSKNPDNDQQRAANLARNGIIKIRNGNLSQGFRDITQAWEIAPSLNEAGVVIALVHLQDKEYQEALNIAKKLQKSQPKQAEGYVLEGIAYAGLENQDSSIAAFKKALKVHPGEPNASLNLARYALIQGDTIQAKKLYENALTYDPDNLKILLSFARLENASENTEHAYLLIQKAVNKHPLVLQPYVEMAKFYAANGEIQKAITVLKSTSIKFPNEIIPPYFLALLYEKLQQRTKALHEIDAVLRINPQYAPSKLLQAKLFIQEGQFKRSQKLLNELATRFPSNADIKQLQGTVALILNQPESAIVFFEQALKTKENNFIVIRLAEAQFRSGRFNASFKTLLNWLTKHPNDISSRSSLADLLISQGKFDEAQHHYAYIAQQNQNNAGVQNNLAWLLTKTGDFDEALKHAKKAITLAPNNPVIMDTLGVILLSKAHYKEAINLLYKAHKKTPKNLTIQFHLAQALVATKNTSDAKKLLKALLAENKRFTEYQEATNLLNKLEQKK